MVCVDIEGIAKTIQYYFPDAHNLFALVVLIFSDKVLDVFFFFEDVSLLNNFLID